MTTLAEIPQEQIPCQEATLSFRNILLATDFSDASEKAFNYAIAIARLHGSKIYLVHVLRPEFTSVVPEPPSDWVRHEAEREMEALASRSELEPIAHETVVRMGSVWSVLSAVVDQENIDLIMLGTHGRGGLKKLLLGSVAEEVVRKVSCPVITVGPHIDISLSTAGDFHRILFATDFHPASAKALEYALLLANQFRAKLILLHLMPPAVLPSPGVTFYNEKAVDKWQAKERASAEHRLEEMLPVSIRLWSEPEYVVGFDFVADGILKVAAEQKADLIIMGANRSISAKVSAHALKAVSYEVIRRSRCPVLTVNAKTG